MSTTPENLTDAQIVSLAHEARQAGDYAMVAICQIALHAKVEPHLARTLLTPADKDTLNTYFATQAQARIECARVIADAEAAAADDAPSLAAQLDALVVAAESLLAHLRLAAQAARALPQE